MRDDMIIINRKVIKGFWKKYPDSENWLCRWFKGMQKNEFTSFEELRLAFPHIEQSGDRTAFAVEGSKYWLVSIIDFNQGRVYIRQILTALEYSKGV